MMVNATQTTTMTPFEGASSLVPMVVEQQLEHPTTSKEPQKTRNAVDQRSSSCHDRIWIDERASGYGDRGPRRNNPMQDQLLVLTFCADCEPKV